MLTACNNFPETVLWLHRLITVEQLVTRRNTSDGKTNYFNAIFAYESCVCS